MANKTATVEVQRIHQKGKFWSIMDTQEQWYGFGMNKPKFDVGDTISFEYSVNGAFKNAEAKTVEIVAEAQETETAPAATKSSGGQISRDEYWSNKEKLDVLTQREIRWAGSRNAAIEFVKLAVSLDALPFSKTKGDKEEILVQYLTNYTNMFYAETTAARDKTDAQALSEAIGYDIATAPNGVLEDDDLESIR